MNNMELRSSRSRSKTPFLTQNFISDEVVEAGNHVEKTVTRSTRRTTIYKTSEGATSSTEQSIYSKPIKKTATRSERSLRSGLFKTSDYSSEDGENEVSSTKTISQNEKNQLIEDARSAAINGDMPALELYKKSGRYWEQKYSRWSIIKNTTVAILTSVITILTSIVEVFYYTYRVQTNLLSKVHNLAGRVMLFDTWLLWKTRPGNKATKLALLCLIPLLLFGGWWLLSGLGSVLYATFSNSMPLTTGNLVAEIHPSSSDLRSNSDSGEKKIQENGENYIDLSDEQVELIARTIKSSFHSDTNRQINTDELVRRIVENHNFHTFVDEEVLGKQRASIDALTKEIKNMKRDTEKLSVEMKRCCKKSVINTESYVSRVVTDLINNPDFLRNQKGLNDWLESLFVAKEALEQRLANVTLNVDSKTAELVRENGKILMDRVAASLSDVNKLNVDYSSGSIDEDQIKRIVRDVLAVYDADKTGLVDYAMETMGGQIVTTRCTETYHHGKAVVSVLGIPLWYPVNSPRNVITPGINPGDCWAFQNFPGFVVIKLSGMVELEAFSLEHISKLLVPDGRIDSAPRDFEVYGLTGENEKEPVKLGSYTYNYDGDPLQFFAVEGERRVFGMIELRVTSNHGNPNYTCLYRFRVHGKPYRDEQVR
ncbi:SUN domain-containing protein 1 isoform X2 [Cylas formicarius]|uniref:SUN domain-containing protein 1 isoform X2 n=1 Tax=Cylas formicarius TaxID=197179 RepID=UPI0029588392|nr:SUN domain-containing protein 1 isoform X2 [Cylas formicarius]